MAEYTANAIQLVAANSNVQFTETPVSGNRANIEHREGSGLFTLKGNTCQCRARYKVFFSGNIAVPEDGTVGPISLALSISGEPIASSTMIATPAAADEYWNVSSAVFVDVPSSCCLTVSVKNTTVNPVNVQNANLIIERVA